MDSLRVPVANSRSPIAKRISTFFDHPEFRDDLLNAILPPNFSTSDQIRGDSRMGDSFFWEAFFGISFK